MGNLQEVVMFFNAAYIGTLENVDNAKLAKECYDLKDLNTGVKRSNIGGWHSDDLTLSKVHPKSEMYKFITEVDRFANSINEVLDIKDKLYLDTFWVNINGKGNANNSHTHPGFVLSGCYYVQCNQDSGKIVFDRGDLQEHYFTARTYNSPQTYRNYSFDPSPGMICMFPAYMDHLVEANKSEEDRISIAFNFVSPNQ